MQLQDENETIRLEGTKVAQVRAPMPASRRAKQFSMFPEQLFLLFCNICIDHISKKYQFDQINVSILPEFETERKYLPIFIGAKDCLSVIGPNSLYKTAKNIKTARVHIP